MNAQGRPSMTLTTGGLPGFMKIHASVDRRFLGRCAQRGAVPRLNARSVTCPIPGGRGRDGSRLSASFSDRGQPPPRVAGAARYWWTLVVADPTASGVDRSHQGHERADDGVYGQRCIDGDSGDVVCPCVVHFVVGAAQRAPRGWVLGRRRNGELALRVRIRCQPQHHPPGAPHARTAADTTKRLRL